jgi:hypothetical protein
MNGGNGLAFVRTTIGYHDAFGQWPTIQDVVDRLRGYSLESVVSVAARISIVLSRCGDDRFAEGQRLMLLNVFGQDNALGILQAVRQRRGVPVDLQNEVIFYERQTQNLLKIAFNVLPVDPPTNPQSDLNALGQALLMMSDLLDEHMRGADPTTEDGKRAFQLDIFANTVFHQAKSELAEFARAHALFLRDRPDVRGHIDLEARLANVTGFPAEESWFVIRALHALYFVIDIDHLSVEPPALDMRAAFVAEHDFTQKQSESYFQIVAVSASSLTAVVKAAYPLSDLRYYDNLVFARNPIVYFGDRAWCMSLPLLRDAAGANFQHRFVDPLLFPNRRERDPFYAFRGELVDNYVAECLSRTFPALIDGQALKEDAEGDKSGQKSCDGAILLGTTVLLFETKSSILGLAVRTATSWDAYVTQVERAIVDGLHQIHDTLRRIEVGKSLHRGLDPAKITRYIPISVVSDFPIDPITYAFVRDAAKAAQLLTDPKVSPPQIFDLAELEMLETASSVKRDILSLLDWKLADENSQAMAFKNFCVTTGEDWVVQHNPYLEQYFKSVQDRWFAFFERHRKS